jgi:hypothetical protein
MNFSYLEASFNGMNLFSILFSIFFNQILTIRFKKPRILGAKGCMINFEWKLVDSFFSKSRFIL